MARNHFCSCILVFRKIVLESTLKLEWQAWQFQRPDGDRPPFGAPDQIRSRGILAYSSSESLLDVRCRPHDPGTSERR